MEDKLQQLTQKLYEEGLSKGRSDADELVAKAKKDAAAIIEEARAEADRILKDAKQGAEDLRKNTETEVVLASRQAIGELKQRISSLVIANEITPAVAEAVKDGSFLKEMILTVAKNWNGADQGGADLEVMLPEETSGKLMEDIKSAVGDALGRGIEVKTDRTVGSGFKVAPKDGGYYISFTDEDFDALLREYLRPKVDRLLYGEEK